MSDFNYEISLRPLEHYFFGGERTFGTAGDEQSSYYSLSNRYPQQTTLLGMLRYFLLQQNHCLPLKAHRQKAESLIGQHSFRSDQSKEQSFGVVKSLSGLMLKKDGQYYRIGYALPPESFSLAADKGEVLTAGGLRSSIPHITGYDAKKGLPLQAIPAGADQPAISFDRIFKAQEQVGIRKLSTEEGLFKQKTYSLAAGWQFACFAQLAPQHGLSDGLVKFGADQKQFMVWLKEAKNTDLPQWAGPALPTTCLTLLSDALVVNEMYEDCAFAITQTADFRTVRMAYDDGVFQKDDVKHNLLKRGSILFPKEGHKEKLIKALKANANFRNIGFNQFFISND